MWGVREQFVGQQSGMNRSFTAGVRSRLVAAVMVATVPMIAFAQTTAPTIEGEPGAASVAEVNANPISESNGSGPRLALLSTV